MKRYMYVWACVLLFPSLLLAQLNVDSIFLWDNDRGDFYQTGPACGIRSWGAYIAWVDSRWGDYDIYKQGIRSNGTYNGGNTMVSADEFNEYTQNYPDIEANPNNYAITVWEDSSYRKGHERPAQIWARLHYGDPFMVYGNERSQKRPAVSCRINGDFVVSWTSYDEVNPAILCRRYNNGGSLQDHYFVKDFLDFHGRIPVSKAAYCDSGFLVVFEDTLDDGTQRSIFGQYRKVDGGLLMDFKKLSHEETSDGDNEEYPDVAINENGNIVVVWQDSRNGNWDIYAQQFQAYRDGFDWAGPELQVTSLNTHQYRPKVALFEDGSFVVTWFEARSGNYDIWGKTCIQGSFREEFRANAMTTGAQWFPDIAGRYGDTVFIAWQSRAVSNWDKVYCRGFRFFPDSPEGVSPLFTPEVPVTPDTCYAGGRRGWYFDDENYDNPATAWNEDPIDEPDSVYLHLEEAIIDQIMELNINGQYMIFCEETLPCREQDGSRAGTDAYDALFIDCGYRTLGASAGVITSPEQTEIVAFLYDQKPVMVEGNDFGRDYNGTTMFAKFKADYLGDGAPYTEGNIDTLYGVENTSFADESLAYDYQSLVDNYVDSIRPVDPNRYELLLESNGAPSDWLAGRCVGWGAYWDVAERASDSFTIYSSFMLSSIKSTTHPHTYAEFYRRLLGYLGLNCQPEPIVDITTTESSSEGRVYLEWLVVSDDRPNESAEGDYKLKFSRTKMTSETEFDNAEEYYQTWYTGSYPVGDTITQYLYGLPPAETLVFALKVSDEMDLWDALGAEPQAVIGGDTLTPHYIYVGSNYVKDFQNGYEYLNRREVTSGDYDSLFVTWNASYFFVGFARCDFVNGGGDLFVYVDTRPTDGADSTYGYNGATGKSAFEADVGEFKPDYLFVLENAGTYEYKRYVNTDDGRGSWVDTTFSGYYSEDNVVNDYEYTEIRIPFSNMGYSSSDPFKLVVLVGRETTNMIINAYPIFNPIGATGVIITQYYYWTHLGSGMVPNRTAQVIGIQEDASIPVTDLQSTQFLLFPNPFQREVEIHYVLPGNNCDASIRIYDVTGRIVRRFEHLHTAATDHLVWNGTDEVGRKVSQGIYFCEYAAGEKTSIKKVVYIK
jgi:hypothetical protein